MRIATYNVWNDSASWPRRLAAIVGEVVALDADVVALQEAPTQATDEQSLIDLFRQQTRYPHLLHVEEPGEPDVGERPEGLAFLSKHPIRDVRTNWDQGELTDNNWAVRIVVDLERFSLGITNVHLDWKRAAGRERALVRIVRDLVENSGADHDILCGDFNDDGGALIVRFLGGHAPLGGYSTCWRDLGHEWHAARGEAAPSTLDTLSNPRWAGQQTDEAPRRFDRVYLRDEPASSDLRVVWAGLFGKEPVNRSGIVPSDHYGVFVDLAADSAR